MLNMVLILPSIINKKRMKKLLILTAAVLFMAVYVKAQTGDPELDYIKKTYSKDKKSIVDEYMNLNVQEGGKFWPIYADYEANREKIAAARIDLINQYTHKYSTFTSVLTHNLFN